MADNQLEQQIKGCGCLVIIVGVAALFAYDCIFTPESEKAQRRKESAQQDRYYDARWAIEDAVRRRLVAPSSAKFSGHKYKIVSPNHYFLEGYVDSQNRFGAMLRMYWAAHAKFSGPGDENPRVEVVTLRE